MRPIVLTAGLLAACAPGLANDRLAVPAAVPTGGKTESCIPLIQVRQTHVRSDSVIDFEMKGGAVYRNALPYPCPGLGSEKRYVHETSINQICSSDTIRVLYSSPSPLGATCGLGQFVPVTLAPREK